MKDWLAFLRGYSHSQHQKIIFAVHYQHLTKLSHFFDPSQSSSPPFARTNKAPLIHQNSRRIMIRSCE